MAPLGDFEGPVVLKLAKPIAKRARDVAWLLPPIAFLALFLVAPLVALLRHALFPAGRPTLGLLADIFSSPGDRQAILNSLALGLGATLVALALALPYAWWVMRLSLPGRRLLQGLVLVPLLLPPFAGALALRQIFGPQGTVNLLLMQAGWSGAPIPFLGSGFWGCVILEGLHLFPILFFFLAPAIGGIALDQEEAGRMLGPKDWRFYWRIVLPPLWPAIIAGSSLVFAWGFTDLGTPLLLDYRQVLPYRVFALVNDLDQNPRGYALALILLLLGLLIVGLGRFAESRLGRYAALAHPRNLPVSPSGAMPYFAALILWLVLAFAALPLLGTVLMAFSSEWFLTPWPTGFTYEHAVHLFQHRLTRGSLINSLFLASLATLLDLVLGLWLALALHRRRGVVARLLESLTLSPLLVPGILVAFSYVGFFSGSALDPTRNPLLLLVAAFAVRRLPFTFKSLSSQLASIPLAEEEAAKLVGTTAWQRLWTLQLPRLSAQAIGSGLLVFAFSVLEVSDALVLAAQEPYFPLTKTVYFLAGRVGDGHALAAGLSLIGVAILLLAMLAANKLLGSGFGATLSSSRTVSRIDHNPQH